MSDTIGNMLAQISNANHKFKESIEMPSSKLKIEIARVLKEDGYISHYRVVQDRKQGMLKINLKYTPQKERVIQGMERYSRPSLRVYHGWQDLPIVQNGLGVAVVSTSKGVMSGNKAKQSKQGGEVLCLVW
ncbi:30S ribosomal protein S8 [bacterium F11]|nr:30S ribosomal protein S8 [bacterium F11]